MAVDVRRVLFTAGLILVLGGLVGLVLPMVPGWPLIFMALPVLAIALIVHLIGGPPRLRRRHLVAGLAATIIIGASVWAWTVIVSVSHHDLESAVTRSSAPGAAHPLRIDRWGGARCNLPIPMGPGCPTSDLLYDSGSVPAERLRQQWQDALARDGWTRHTETGDVWPPVWWSRGEIAIALFIQADRPRGPYFVWGSSDLLVTTQRVSDPNGEIPSRPWA
ncbi:MAG TPA: hypothetical protein VKG85_12380 [Actinomycetes bacterium]|nr:hypothetical protein [Actinomycetes bacterium]